MKDAFKELDKLNESLTDPVIEEEIDPRKDPKEEEVEPYRGIKISYISTLDHDDDYYYVHINAYISKDNYEEDLRGYDVFSLDQAKAIIDLYLDKGVEEADKYWNDWNEHIGKLDEALPSDLAKWYKRVPTTRGYLSSPLGDERRSAKVRFSDASYEEITNKKALDLTNEGRDKVTLSKLRLLFHKSGADYNGYVRYNAEGKQIFYRADGVISDKFEAKRNKEDKDHRYYSRGLVYQKRSGNTTTDTREMPAWFLITWADKIYLTDDDDPKYKIDRQSQWNSRYGDMAEIDTGSHRRGWSDPRRDRADEIKSAKRELERIAEYEQKIKDLDAKFEAGDISKNEYEKTKAEYQSQINYRKDNYEDYMLRAERYRREYRDRLAKDTYRWSEMDLEKTKEKYREIKHQIRNIENRIDDAKGGLDWGDDEAARTYEKKVSRLEQVKKSIEELTKELNDLNTYMADPSHKQHHDEYVASKASKLDAELANAQKDLNAILGKNNTTEIGAQESLEEAVNDADIYAVGDYYIRNLDIRNSDEWKEWVKKCNISIDDIHDFYDADFPADKFHKLNEIMSKDWHTYSEGGEYYLELSDRHTLFDDRFKNLTDEQSDGLYDIYNSNVEHAAEDFKDVKGLDLYFLGRSGRHVCVKLFTETVDKLEDLKEYQKALEDQAIDNTIKIAKGETIELADLNKDEE